MPMNIHANHLSTSRSPVPQLCAPMDAHAHTAHHQIGPYLSSDSVGTTSICIPLSLHFSFWAICKMRHIAVSMAIIDCISPYQDRRLEYIRCTNNSLKWIKCLINQRDPDFRACIVLSITLCLSFLMRLIQFPPSRFCFSFAVLFCPLAYILKCLANVDCYSNAHKSLSCKQQASTVWEWLAVFC